MGLANEMWFVPQQEVVKRRRRGEPSWEVPDRNVNLCRRDRSWFYLIIIFAVFDHVCYGNSVATAGQGLTNRALAYSLSDHRSNSFIKVGVGSCPRTQRHYEIEPPAFLSVDTVLLLTTI